MAKTKKTDSGCGGGYIRAGTITVDDDTKYAAFYTIAVAGKVPRILWAANEDGEPLPDVVKNSNRKTDMIDKIQFEKKLQKGWEQHLTPDRTGWENKGRGINACKDHLREVWKAEFEEAGKKVDALVTRNKEIKAEERKKQAARLVLSEDNFSDGHDDDSEQDKKGKRTLHTNNNRNSSSKNKPIGKGNSSKPSKAATETTVQSSAVRPDLYQVYGNKAETVIHDFKNGVFPATARKRMDGSTSVDIILSAYNSLGATADRNMLIAVSEDRVLQRLSRVEQSSLWKQPRKLTVLEKTALKSDALRVEEANHSLPQKENNTQPQKQKTMKGKAAKRVTSPVSKLSIVTITQDCDTTELAENVSNKLMLNPEKLDKLNARLLSISKEQSNADSREGNQKEVKAIARQSAKRQIEFGSEFSAKRQKMTDTEDTRAKRSWDEETSGVDEGGHRSKRARASESGGSIPSSDTPHEKLKGDLKGDKMDTEVTDRIRKIEEIWEQAKRPHPRPVFDISPTPHKFYLRFSGTQKEDKDI